MYRRSWRKHQEVEGGEFKVGEQTRSEISVSLRETVQSILIREHGAVRGLDNDPNGKSLGAFIRLE